MATFETGTAIFDETTRLFLVKTPKGEFAGVPSVGGFDNYREMDAYVGDDWKISKYCKTGVMAYLLDCVDETQYLFYYPDPIGGDITVFREN